MCTGTQILPGRVRTCPEDLSRTRKRYVPALGGNKRRKGPGQISSGGITFQPGVGAKFWSVLKHGSRVNDFRAARGTVTRRINPRCLVVSPEQNG